MELPADRPVEAAFSWSHRRLNSAAARMFRLLGSHPEPELGLPAAAALAGTTTDAARRLLASLTGVNLVEKTVSGQYRLHDLLRLYASERAEAEESSHVHDAPADLKL